MDGVDRLLKLVLAGPWYDVERFHRSDRHSESVVIRFYVHFASRNNIHSWFKLFGFGVFDNIK